MALFLRHRSNSKGPELNHLNQHKELKWNRIGRSSASLALAVMAVCAVPVLTQTSSSAPPVSSETLKQTQQNQNKKSKVILERSTDENGDVVDGANPVSSNPAGPNPAGQKPAAQGQPVAKPVGSSDTQAASAGLTPEPAAQLAAENTER